MPGLSLVTRPGKGISHMNNHVLTPLDQSKLICPKCDGPRILRFFKRASGRIEQALGNSVLLFIAVLFGCTSGPVTKQATAPTGASQTKVEILSDPPGARIEVDNNYVGDAPLETEIANRPNINPSPIVITATPRDNGYVQTKIIQPWQDIPSRIFFDMSIKWSTQ